MRFELPLLLRGLSCLYCGFLELPLLLRGLSCLYNGEVGAASVGELPWLLSCFCGFFYGVVSSGEQPLGFAASVA